MNNDDKTLAQPPLPDKAIALINRPARLGDQLAPLTLGTLAQHMLAINSYYSNLIEGNATRPHTAFVHGEIERAQALELCAMPERTARRLLSQLKNDGLLSESSSKSPLRWEIPEHAEPWYFPQFTS